MSLEHSPARQRRPGIGHNAGPPLDDLKVLTIKQFAAICGISVSSAKKLLWLGQGPKTIQLTKRRVGIRVVDLRKWQESRARE
jgi:predicted DNA-binding transcriptional regulator AlpA